MNKKHRHTAYYNYMAPFLETGNEKVIAKAKKEYRRKYKAAWRKAKRKQVKEITTAWEREEYRGLNSEAQRHKECVTRFVKRATIGYMNTRYVVPDEARVTKVIQLLALTYNSLSELRDASTITAGAVRKALSDITQLEHDVRIAFYSPKTIEQIIKEYIDEKPKAKEKLIGFIQSI